MVDRVGKGADAFTKLVERQARRDVGTDKAAKDALKGLKGAERAQAIAGAVAAKVAESGGVELKSLQQDRGAVKGATNQELAAAFAQADAANPDGKLDASEFEQLMAIVSDGKAAEAAARKDPAIRAAQQEAKFLAELPALVQDLGKPIKLANQGPLALQNAAAPPGGYADSARIAQFRAYLRDRSPAGEARNQQIIGAVSEAAAAFAGQANQRKAVEALAKEAGATPANGTNAAAAEALRSALGGAMTRKVRDAAAQALLRGDRGALRDLAADLAPVSPALQRRIDKALADPKPPKVAFKRTIAGEG